jgi:uncharacterized protein (DUF302 family)
MTTNENTFGLTNCATGLTTLPSDFGPKETMDRLEAEVKADGMIIFARINHAELAAKTKQALRPTDLLIFGNPHSGTPLMRANPTIAIDLPMKVVIWQDAVGRTWLTYNEPGWLARRHELGAEASQIIDIMELGLEVIAKRVTLRTSMKDTH